MSTAAALRRSPRHLHRSGDSRPPKRLKRNGDNNPFIDIEAQQSGTEDEDSEDGDDNDEDGGIGSSTRRTASMGKARTRNLDIEGSSGPAVDGDDEDILNIVTLSLSDDFKPLWRFRCALGKESAVCTRLRSIVANDRLRGLNLSFKSYHHIRGWVYVAGQPRSPVLCRWIRRMSPYVLRRGIMTYDADIICESVEEDADLRASSSSSSCYSNANTNDWSSKYLHQWVRIRNPGGRVKGNTNGAGSYNYAGEIGFVIQTSGSEKRVKVLLVPRISLEEHSFLSCQYPSPSPSPSPTSSPTLSPSPHSSPGPSEASTSTSSSASSSSTTSSTRKRKRPVDPSISSSSSSRAGLARVAPSTSTTPTPTLTLATDPPPPPPHRLFNPTEIRRVYGPDSVVPVRGKGAGHQNSNCQCIEGDYWFQPKSKSKSKSKRETERERERYQNGLLVKMFRVNQVSLLDAWDRDGVGDGFANTNAIPFSLYNLFRQSGHEHIPDNIRGFPRIEEWVLDEGDRVRVRDGDRGRSTTTTAAPGSGSRSENGNGNRNGDGDKGAVGTVLRSWNNGQVEVNFGLPVGTSTAMLRNGIHEGGGIPYVNAAAAANPYSLNPNPNSNSNSPHVHDHPHTYRYVGRQSIPWWNLVKIFSLGDYVQVIVGIHKGACGWVVSANDDGDRNAHTLKNSSVSRAVHARAGGGGQKNRTAHWWKDEVVEIAKRTTPIPGTVNGTGSDGGSVQSMTVHANFFSP